MLRLRIQVGRLSPQSSKRAAALLVLLIGSCFSAQNGHGDTNCCAGAPCIVDSNASRAPAITILSGLRPNAPQIATLAREHTQRALAPTRDARLSRVVLAGEAGASLEQDGPGFSDAWYAPTGAVDVQLLWDVRYLNDSSSAVASVTAATAAGALSAASATLMTAATAAASGDGSSPAWNAHVMGALEYATVPLLRAHASGNTSSLRQLDSGAAAGKPLPPQLMVPPPGQPGGPAAAPLLLLYRRDWWRALVAAGGAGRTGGGDGTTAAEAEAVLPPTWPLLAQLASRLLNQDLDGDGLQDHVLCVDLMPGCKGWALLSAIFASMAQTNGTQQGVWFNLTDLSPALGGPALPAALRLYADLAASNAAPFTPGGANVSLSAVHVSPAEILAAGGAVDTASGAPLCGAVNPLFAAGRCLFTVDWAAAALRLTQEGAKGISGRLAAALLPGSAIVQNQDMAAADAAAASTAGKGQPSVAPIPTATPIPTTIVSSTTSASTTEEHDTAFSTAGRLRACSPSICWSRQGMQPTSGPPAAAAVAAVAVAGQQGSVNVAPFVGEATNVWLLPRASRWELQTLSLAGAFTEHVGYELDLKYGILTNSIPDIREFSSARAALQGGQQQQQTGDDDDDMVVALSSTLTGSVTGGLACAGGLLSMLAEAAEAGKTGPEAAAGVLGLERSDLLSVSQAFAKATSHGNAALDITLPYSAAYRGVLDDLAASALRVVAEAAAAAAAAAAAPLSDATGTNASMVVVGARRIQAVVAAGVADVNGEEGGDGGSGGADAAWLRDAELFAPLAAAAARDFEAITARFPYPAILRQLHVNAIGHLAAAEEVTAAAAAAGRHSVARRVGLPVGVALGGIACALAGLGCAYLAVQLRLRTAMRGGNRAALPPGPGPDTTLVMTDVQNSTLLWEVLSSGVMDSCLAIHHRIMRQAIECHSGYEVFTEGDAFAVAFHGPDDALGFAMDVQAALLEAEWPQPLLQQPDACEVWALLRRPCRPHQPPLQPPSFWRSSRPSPAGVPPGAMAAAGAAAAAAAASSSTSGPLTMDDFSSPRTTPSRPTPATATVAAAATAASFAATQYSPAAGALHPSHLGGPPSGPAAVTITTAPTTDDRGNPDGGGGAGPAFPVTAAATVTDVRRPRFLRWQSEPRAAARNAPSPASGAPVAPIRGVAASGCLPARSRGGITASGILHAANHLTTSNNHNHLTTGNGNVWPHWQTASAAALPGYGFSDPFTALALGPYGNGGGGGGGGWSPAAVTARTYFARRRGISVDGFASVASPGQPPSPLSHASGRWMASARSAFANLLLAGRPETRRAHSSGLAAAPTPPAPMLPGNDPASSAAAMAGVSTMLVAAAEARGVGQGGAANGGGGGGGGSGAEGGRSGYAGGGKGGDGIEDCGPPAQLVIQFDGPRDWSPPPSAPRPAAALNVTHGSPSAAAPSSAGSTASAPVPMAAASTAFSPGMGRVRKRNSGGGGGNGGVDAGGSRIRSIVHQAAADLPPVEGYDAAGVAGRSAVPSRQPPLVDAAAAAATARAISAAAAGVAADHSWEGALQRDVLGVTCTSGRDVLDVTCTSAIAAAAVDPLSPFSHRGACADAAASAATAAARPRLHFGGGAGAAAAAAQGLPRCSTSGGPLLATRRTTHEGLFASVRVSPSVPIFHCQRSNGNDDDSCGNEDDEEEEEEGRTDWQSLVTWEASVAPPPTATAATGQLIPSVPSAPEPLESAGSWGSGNTAFRTRTARSRSLPVRRRGSSETADAVSGGGGGGGAQRAQTMTSTAAATAASPPPVSLPRRLLTGKWWSSSKCPDTATVEFACARSRRQHSDTTQLSPPSLSPPWLLQMQPCSPPRQQVASPPSSATVSPPPPLPLLPPQLSLRHDKAAFRDRAGGSRSTVVVVETAPPARDGGGAVAATSSSVMLPVPQQQPVASLSIIVPSDTAKRSMPLLPALTFGMSMSGAGQGADAGGGGGGGGVGPQQRGRLDTLWCDLNLVATNSVNTSTGGVRASLNFVTTMPAMAPAAEAAAATPAEPAFLDRDNAAVPAAEELPSPPPRVISSVLSVLQKLYELWRPEEEEVVGEGLLGFCTGMDGGGEPAAAAAAAQGASAVPLCSPPPPPEPVLVFRGLRVRMGLHSGALQSEVIPQMKNGVKGVSYTGDFVATCKEVGDAAMGGMVILSQSAFHAHHQQLRTTAAAASGPSTWGGMMGGGSCRDGAAAAPMLLHLGQHIIDLPAGGPDHNRRCGGGDVPTRPASPPRELYAAVSPGLLARLSVLPAPVRTAREVVPGCLSAPAGVVAPVFCNVVGVEALLAWEKVLQARMLRAAAQTAAAAAAAGNLTTCRPLQGAAAASAAADAMAGGGLLPPPPPAAALAAALAAGSAGIVRQALEEFRESAQRNANRHGGYVVASSVDGGHWVLVFGAAENAVLWGLGMLEAMLAASWPEGLLDHELTEEVWEDGVLLNRGLRLCIGIDCGPAMMRLVPRTGRLDYVGRPLNRAARIAAKAKAGTMLVSGAVWEAAGPALESRQVSACGLGGMSLKGVQKQIDLWAIRARGPLAAGEGPAPGS